MQAKELKQFLLADKDRIIEVMAKAGFHDFRSQTNELRCALPDGTNPTGVMVKYDDTLYTAMFEISYTGDLFGALAKVLNFGFSDVMLFIHGLFGLANENNNIGMIDPLSDLKKLANGTYYRNQEPNKLYSPSIMDKYIHTIHHSILEEGIVPRVAYHFGIAYDPYKDRILFPHYDWVHTNKIVGIKGRTTQTAEEMAITGTPKYWNYITGYKKTQNLYGYNIAKDNLDACKMLILFEGEKSVLKQFSYEQGKGCSVALGGHAISENQVEFILKHVPNDCEIVLAFDKDVMTNESEGEPYIKEQVKRFLPFRKASYIYDKYNLLGEKDSPIDKGYKIWRYLLKWRLKV